MVTLRRAFARCVGPSIRFGCAAAHQLSAPYSRYLDTPIAGDLGDRDTLHLTIDRAAPNSRKQRRHSGPSEERRTDRCVQAETANLQMLPSPIF